MGTEEVKLCSFPQDKKIKVSSEKNGIQLCRKMRKNLRLNNPNPPKQTPKT